MCILVLVAMAACEPEPPGASAAPSAEVVYQPKPFDLEGYCTKMCARTVDCGLEAAKGPAALGGDETAKALKEAKAESAELETSCIAGCRAAPIDEEHRSQALQAERCLQQQACSDLEACLATIGAQTGTGPPK